jgi:hypothetical protein
MRATSGHIAVLGLLACLGAEGASATPARSRGLVLSLKAPVVAEHSAAIRVAIERRNIGSQPIVVFVREGCPPRTLDTIFTGGRPLKVDWPGVCDDNHWVKQRLAAGEAATVEYTVSLPRGTHRLHATYVVDAKRLDYDEPDDSTWLGHVESAPVTLQVR